ncbi:MAG: hypothetical protein AAGJ93_06540 [Bacteroidota bacterium]
MKISIISIILFLPFFSFGQTQIGTSEIWHSSNNVVLGGSGTLLSPYPQYVNQNNRILQIKGNDSSYGLPGLAFVKNSLSTDYGGSLLWLSSTYSSDKRYIQIDGQEGNGKSALTFSVRTNADVQGVFRTMTFNSDGYLGVGKTPIHALDVNGTINGDRLLINGNEIPTWHSTNFTFFGSRSLDQTSVFNYALLHSNLDGTTYLNSPQQIHFRINNIDQFILDNSGKIGVGTKFPAYKLDVVGDVNASNLLIDGVSVFESIPVWQNDQHVFMGSRSLSYPIYNGYALLQSNQNGTTFLNSPKEINFRILNVTKFKLASNGKIGIGTEVPNFDLDVNGTINASNILINGEALGSSSSVWTQAQNDISYTGGKVGIDIETIPAEYSLAVGGKIIAEELTIGLVSNWPDYVFEKDYPLLSLTEVATHIEENGHLPEIPSAREVSENGINVSEMNVKLLQKIEELTLYLIEQNTQNQRS